MQHLEERIRTELDPYRHAELRAKRAAYLARTGDFTAARKEIFEVRQAFGDGRSGRVTILLMVSEALVMQYGELSTGALDRIARALLLSQAMKDRELIALTSAWMGFLRFERSDFDLAIRSVDEAIENAAESDHAARSRSAVVLLNAFAFCGDRASSLHWFQKGRGHALAEGDQAGIDALLHSKAVFGVAWLRVQRCKGQADQAAMALSRLEIASARNLQQLTRIAAHADYIELADAMLSSIECQYLQTLATLDSLESKGPFPVSHFNRSVLAIERAYCCARLGRTEEASKLLEQMNWGEVSTLDVDDFLSAAWLANEIATIDPRLGDAIHAQQRLQSALANHAQTTDRLRHKLAKFAKT
jgi:tetratricopeptide (TPR) repeat protein